MKTKRTLFSIVVFLSVCWITVLGISTPFYKMKGKPENSNPSLAVDSNHTYTLDKARLKALSDKYGNVASASDRLYLYEDNNNGNYTDQNTNGIDGSRRYVPVKESTITDPTLTNDEQEGLDEYSAFANTTAINTIQISDLIIDEPTVSQADPALAEELEAKPSVYSDIGISIANSYVNIRDKATTDSEINGKLHRNSAAKILDSVDDWYYIESGSVKGYVKMTYIKTGIPDEELIENYGILHVSINTDGLNVREEPDIESNKITVVYQNELYPVIDLQNEWLKVDIRDDRIIGYVNRDYVELLVDFEEAVSKEEEEELIKLKEEEQERLEKKQNEERLKKETEIKYRDEVDYAKDELKLLASLVHAEAGNQSYEGKLAVANVVLNRVKSRKYPSTIKDVIYQPGQFTVANSGSLAKQLERYVDYTSNSQLLTVKAAKAALSGANNIGNRLYFNAYKSAVKKGYDQKKNSVKIDNHLFW